MMERSIPPDDERWPVVNPAGFVPLPRHAAEAVRGADRAASRFIIHLPVFASSFIEASRLAAVLARSAALLPEVDAHAVTVSTPGAGPVGRRVFCDQLLPDRRNCPLRSDHEGPCTADPTGSP